jgi:hypothetical protein
VFDIQQPVLPSRVRKAGGHAASTIGYWTKEHFRARESLSVVSDRARNPAEVGKITPTTTPCRHDRKASNYKKETLMAQNTIQKSFGVSAVAIAH